jgi:hypothetical protein
MLFIFKITKINIYLYRIDIFLQKIKKEHMFKYMLILFALILWSFLTYTNTDAIREHLFLALIIIALLLVIKHVEKENL